MGTREWRAEIIYDDDGYKWRQEWDSWELAASHLESIGYEDAGQGLWVAKAYPPYKEAQIKFID